MAGAIDHRHGHDSRDGVGAMPAVKMHQIIRAHHPDQPRLSAMAFDSLDRQNAMLQAKVILKA